MATKKFNQTQAAGLTALGYTMIEITLSGDTEPVFIIGYHPDEDERHSGECCIIVGGGPSAKGFVAPEGVSVIAVNGAINWLNRADYCFTLDPSPINMALMLNQKPDVKYYAAVPESVYLPPGVKRMKRIAKRGSEPADKKSVDWLLWRYSCVKTLCTTPGEIHTGNSSWGALGLAYHLGFKHVALIGVDGTSEPTLCGRKTGDHRHLNALFESAIGQINVVSCGGVNSIPQMSIGDWLCAYSRC